MNNFALKQLLGVSFLLLLYCFYCIIQNKVFLSDDLAMVSLPASLNESHADYFSFLKDFIAQDFMTSRPVSAFFTATILFLSKNNILYYHYFNFILVLVGAVLLYKVIKVYFIDKEQLAYLSTAIYIIIPLATSLLYCPIMLNSNLAIILYLISLLLISKHKYILSGLFYLLSILSYEVTFPLILLNLYLVFIREKRNIGAIVCVVILPVALYVIYRYYLQTILFTGYDNRESYNNIAQADRWFQVLYLVGKSYTLDLLVGIKRSLIATEFYSITDIVVVVVFAIISFFAIIKINFDTNIIYIRYVGVFFIIFILSLGVFFISNYIPTIQGYSNRTGGVLKIIFSLLFTSVFFTIYNLCRSRGYKIFLKVCFWFSLCLFAISTISIKNAWAYAGEFNNNLFLEVKNKLPEKLVSDNIAIYYDIEKTVITDKHFIFKEPVFRNRWESEHLLKNNKLLDNLKIEQLTIWDGKVQTYKPENSIFLQFPIYVYDYENKKLLLAETKEQFDLLIKQL